METFSASLAICAGNSPVNGEFPAERPVALMFSLICDLINDWVNNGEAGDLRRHRTHYDVTVMTPCLYRACHDIKAFPQYYGYPETILYDAYIS